jgi:GTP cyclohydrolase I
MGQTNHPKISEAITMLLDAIGEDPSREGLKETPRRAAKAWAEWTAGYHEDPEKILKTFGDAVDGKSQGIICVHNIPVISKCEHHLADIVGIAHVGYIPTERVVGLSKLPRVVNVFARRLQVQERMTSQIANAIFKHPELKPKGVAVIIRAAHHCMSTRGVRIHGSSTTTSEMRGVFEEREMEMKFLAFCQAAEKKHD